MMPAVYSGESASLDKIESSFLPFDDSSTMAITPMRECLASIPALWCQSSGSADRKHDEMKVRFGIYKYITISTGFGDMIYEYGEAATVLYIFCTIKTSHKRHKAEQNGEVSWDAIDYGD